jgi:ketosteroid isomerase-like protein
VLDRAGFAELLRGLRRAFESFSVTVIETVPAEDPDTLVLRYRGDARSADGEFSYRNDYLGMLYFADGLIRHWREYANPVLTRRMNERLAAVATS